MRLSTSLVAVKKIVSSIPSSSFDSGQIEQLAQQILKAEGIVNPLILRRDSLESYEVVDGYFEYYAAVRARELDPRKGEMISAYILEPENDDVSSAIEEQIKLLRESKIIDPPPIDEYEKTTISVSTDIKQLVNKMTKFENSLSDQAKKIENLVKLINESNTLTVQEQLERLENNVMVGIEEIKELIINPPPPPTPKDIINDLNTMDIDDLERHLEKSGKENIKFARLIYEKRLEQPFQTIDDVWKNKKTKITRLGEKTMQKIIANW